MTIERNKDYGDFGAKPPMTDWKEELKSFNGKIKDVVDPHSQVENVIQAYLDQYWEQAEPLLEAFITKNRLELVENILGEIPDNIGLFEKKNDNFQIKLTGTELKQLIREKYGK